MEEFRYSVSEVYIPYSQIFGKNVNFNPSIVHIDDDYFLMSFHTFRKNKGHPITHEVEGTIEDPYHMYYGGIGSNTYWNHKKGQWGTGFMIVQINDGRVDYVQSLEFNDYGTDMRLIQTPDGIIGTMSGGNKISKKGTEREHYLLPKATTRNFSIAALEIDIVRNQSGRWFLHGAEDPGDLLCETLQDNEKNWSLWYYNQLYISNYLIPRHIVFVPANSTCKVIASQDASIFNGLEVLYKKSLLFSLSTPAIPYNNVMIGVGHIKLDKNKLPTLSRGYVFLKNNQYLIHPSNTYYMMFLYTFDPVTLNILKVSAAFYPPDTNHAVVFPAGLTYYDGDYLISYGEGDSKMKIMFIDDYDVDRLLVPASYYEEEYDFIYL